MRITEFLQPFFPDENESVFLFAFEPKEKETRDAGRKLEVSRHKLKTDLELQQELKMLNRQRGIYFTVNSGGTKKDQINRTNAVFCEMDDLPLEAQHDAYDNCPLPPSIRVETKKSVHAYWLLKESLSIDDWISRQLGLIQYFNSDKSLNNQNRIMRLPFLNHVTYTKEGYQLKPVTVHTFNETRFEFDELAEAFPYVEPKVEHIRFEGSIVSDSWQELFMSLKDRIMSMPSFHYEHGERLASAQGICHNGDSNRTLVLCLDSGKVFCRNQCSFDMILEAFGLKKPQKFQIARQPRKHQNSELYQWYRKYKYES